MPFKVGDRVINHCDHDSIGTVTAIDPEDEECYVVDNIDSYHEQWLELVKPKEEKNG